MRKTYSGREIDAALCRKGFRCETDSDHFWYYFPNRTGKGYATRTKISHGMKTKSLGAGLVSLMARQCGLSTEKFLAFVDCKMTEEAYRDILREKGFDV